MIPVFVRYCTFSVYWDPLVQVLVGPLVLHKVYLGNFFDPLVFEPNIGGHGYQA